jgi:hypothetical protein
MIPKCIIDNFLSEREYIQLCCASSLALLNSFFLCTQEEKQKIQCDSFLVVESDKKYTVAMIFSETYFETPKKCMGTHLETFHYN